ncbi:MAG: hypothetical protein BWX99_00164 [Deltaproteobacteria bacterium ADurb.Bin151]|jgi:hypothetical protein|nr:MAG: hypothetical protein BWX99_00164 [Deltaproteobacteria bacterium ADurb.Bin151]
MQFTFAHNNFNVLNLEKSLPFMLKLFRKSVNFVRQQMDAAQRNIY